VSENNPDEMRKSLVKKMRSLKFLGRLKEKRKKKVELEKEIERVEKGSKMRSSKIDIFNSNLLS
jgi:hypothetical protein